ncbi:MAG TPA: PDZ domain-containing protein [Candidatus Binataceae bacterium]|nr:PDZ domain-containing protein [Candidatus Binataceae bacterium]
MSRVRKVALGVLLATIVAVAGRAPAQNSAPPADPRTQQGAPLPPSGINSQGGAGGATLEIAPQPGLKPAKPGVEEVPGGDNFRPGEDTSSVNPQYQPGVENGDSNTLNPNPQNGVDRHAKPYLGITVNETTKCYLGMEEHGLEILTVDPNSPAWGAGLHGSTGANAIGATASTVGDLVPFLGTILTSQLAKRGDLGLAGDLIVAVDDHRVRTQQDLDDAIAKLKPGDTMYLTIIRELPGGGHTTKKIEVHVGQVGQPLPVANAAPALTE